MAKMFCVKIYIVNTSPHYYQVINHKGDTELIACVCCVHACVNSHLYLCVCIYSVRFFCVYLYSVHVLCACVHCVEMVTHHSDVVNGHTPYLRPCGGGDLAKSALDQQSNNEITLYSANDGASIRTKP